MNTYIKNQFCIKQAVLAVSYLCFDIRNKRKASAYASMAFSCLLLLALIIQPTIRNELKSKRLFGPVMRTMSCSRLLMIDLVGLN